MLLPRSAVHCIGSTWSAQDINAEPPSVRMHWATPSSSWRAGVASSLVQSLCPGIIVSLVEDERRAHFKMPSTRRLSQRMSNKTRPWHRSSRRCGVPAFIFAFLQTLCSDYGAPRTRRLSSRGLWLNHIYLMRSLTSLCFSICCVPKAKDVSTICEDLRALSRE